MFVRLLSGAAIALVIALLARRSRALSAGGAVAAFVIGTLAITAEWSWGALLVAYFVSSTALSRHGAAIKELRTARVVAKGGERDATQVLANGAGFGLAAALSLLPPVASSPTTWIQLAAFGAGTLAASASDTWATEIGTLASGRPRSIITFQSVEAGTSGGVTLAGIAAAVGGAALVAIVALILAWPTRVAFAAFVGGIAGSTLDSVLGASIQERRWCDRCECGTERVIHDCGSSSRPLGGLPWLDNDAVNFVSNSLGGLLAMLLAR